MGPGGTTLTLGVLASIAAALAVAFLIMNPIGALVG